MNPRGAEKEYLQEGLRSGLKLDARFDALTPHLHVAWISWDSGFRGSGLRVGDRVIAIDGQPVVKPPDLATTQRTLPFMLGQYAENQTWDKQGRKEGDKVQVRIVRRREPGEGWEEHEFSGALLHERTWSIADTTRQLIGPGGPERMGRDGFDEAWMSWLEKRVFDWERLLDSTFGAWRTSRGTRAELANHLGHKARVDFLVEHHPGPFATAMREDWETVRACLDGDLVTLPADALEFRTRGEEQVKAIGLQAAAAWKALLEARAGETLSAFPVVDPFRGDRSAVTGKLVSLPTVTQREWLVDMGKGYLAWNQSGAWVFCPANTPAMNKVFSAMQRYQKRVAPSVRLDIAVLGRILPDPRLLAGSGRTAAGLEVEPVAALVGGVVCVDVSDPSEGGPRFAGEETLSQESFGAPADDASPREVLTAMISAVKRGDQETWNGLFADWRAVPDADRPIYYPVWTWNGRDSEWVRSRQLLLNKVLDARVRWMGDVRVVIQGDEAPGLQRIEEVELEVDHVGLFEGQTRTFNSVDVRRRWTVQRRNGGPWRITSEQSL
ncbi:hypothetical protein HPP05_15030 [Corallococcus exiguus]|uniref:hypothetical protein n=1 Tax=Corallococcus exiguus TaxID=83462 RepID=UPI0014946BB5|nr:hypothetical protein [Corallococcus exiguus]NPC71063.1 hypothetical protein [Corallococcus exiguus]